MHYMGPSPGLLQGDTGEAPARQGESSRNRGGRRQPKCANCSLLRDQTGGQGSNPEAPGRRPAFRLPGAVGFGRGSGIVFP